MLLEMPSGFTAENRKLSAKAVLSKELFGPANMPKDVFGEVQEVCHLENFQFYGAR